MRKGRRCFRNDIEDRLQVARLALEEDPRVVFAYLFGGYGRGRPGPLSDVDIAVYLDHVSDISMVRLDLIGSLAGALESDEFDLVILNTAPLSLAGRVQESARVLVDKDRARRFAYESLIRRAFADFRFQEERILKRRFKLG